MDEQAILRERLRKVEALFARPGNDGERMAAEAALTRIRERLAVLRRQDPSYGFAFAVSDQWPRELLTFFERHGLYQRDMTAAMVRGAAALFQTVVWPEFEALARFWRTEPRADGESPP